MFPGPTESTSADFSFKNPIRTCIKRGLVLAAVLFVGTIPAGSSHGETLSRQDSAAFQIADGNSHGSSHDERGRDRESRKKSKDPVRIQRRGNLRFGRFGSNGPAGMITINPNNGLKTVSGGVFDFGGVHSRARFRIRGERNTYVVVTLPNQVPITAVGSGTLSMTLQNFTMNATNPIFLGPSGRVDIYVGATLVVGQSQHRGVYHGSFTVEAEYP
ncbi:MAG: DUF4402 domain-containing protein [Rhodospirillales bacterium]